MSARTLRGQRILVVEDQYAIALDLCESLKDEGASVVGPVATVEDALGLLETGIPPDVAVLDIKLQGEFVYPVANRLQQLGVPYVFATACLQTEIPDPYRVAMRCEKPVRLTTILDAIERASSH